MIRKEQAKMIKSLSYVVKEHISNIYRMWSIAKYEFLADYRDSKLGILWGILDPLIQLFTYWFVFGIGIRGGKDVGGVPFLNWMLIGTIPWFFISDSIRSGVNSIHKKANIVTKMKFPLSILPTTEVLKSLFTHLITFMLVYIFLIFQRLDVRLFHLEVLYYLFCAIALCISIGLITSVLNMFTRDVKRVVNASMRLLMYMTPIFWTMENLPSRLQKLMKFNPMYYIVSGYRDSLFYYEGIMSRGSETIVFWLIVVALFMTGSYLMYKFKHKFIDFI